MDIQNFSDAVLFYRFCKEFQDDIPDGQWDQIKEILDDYMDLYGKKPSLWPEHAKDSFTADIRDNMLYWL